MITRENVISQAIDGCMQELYKWVQPSITWEEFKEENKIYLKGDQTLPKPYEFYYLDKEILKEIVENYAEAYNFDPKLKQTIKILIDYCEEPIVDKWIEGKNEEDPGHRGYEHLESIVNFIGKEHWDKIKEYLNMAGDFFVWNRDLQEFNISVYLGASPNSNKEAVIKNWKEYREKDIKIKEITKEEFENEYYC